MGAWTGQELLGARAVAGMLMFATVSGILMALFLNTAGGAWDNAKKYVETGAHGGKIPKRTRRRDGRHGGGSVQGYRGAEHTRAHQDARHHHARHGAHVPRLRLRRRGKEPARVVTSENVPVWRNCYESHELPGKHVFEETCFFRAPRLLDDTPEPRDLRSHAPSPEQVGTYPPRFPAALRPRPHAFPHDRRGLRRIT